MGLVKPSPLELALLVLLAALLLSLRANRERYTRFFVLGWAAFVASRVLTHVCAADIQARFLPVIEQTLFVGAVGLLAGGILLYTRERDLFIPLAVITPVLAGFAAARILLWPDAVPLRVAQEVGYRIVLLTAALVLLRARRGRWELGSSVLALSLLGLHLDWQPFTSSLSPALFATTEIALGVSMILVALDEARIRGRRLAVLQALTSGMASAQQYGNLVNTALHELQRLTKIKAAWFRLIEGGHLVATHAVGVSANFLREAGFAEITQDVNRMLEQGRPQVVSPDKAAAENAECVKAEKIKQVMILPVVGKKAAVGVLLLGSARNLGWTVEELEFLQGCARHLAIAVENFRLLEQVLRSQRQWMNTFDSIHDIILAHDADYRIIKANQVLLEHIGQAAADVLGNTCDSVLPHTLGEWTGCPYCATRGEEEFSEGADPCFGGFSVVSTSSYSEQGTPQKGVIHVVRDITERRSAEEKYRLLFEQVQEGVYVATPTGQIVDCNDAFVHMLGFGNRADVLALNLNSEICVDSAQREAFRKEMEAHNFVRNFEVTLRRKDGSLLLAAESSFATRDAAGKIERYQGFVLDVTEKRRAEEEMRRRNRELNALNAMAVVATQSFDLDEILNLTLRQVVSLFGAESGSVYLADTDAPTFRRRAAWGPRSRDKARPAEITFTEGFGDLVMRSRTEVITADYLPHLPKPVAEFVRSENDRSWIWVLFWGKDSPTGIMGLCSNAGYEYSTDEESLLVAISRQVATTIEKVRLYEETCRAYEDLRKMQEQLLQSEKMSAVGQLIAGVAHELNNPLTAILGYAQLLETEGLNERAKDYVGKMFKQAQRTHRVVQNLLSFARQRTPQREEVDLRKVLDETLALRDYDLKTNNIRVEKDVPEASVPVVADPHQIEQVFLNIINNAVDAMLETGKPGTLRIRVGCEHGQACTQFADEGPGIKDPKRIFDPFYTTKSVGKGTGLGLSICYGIVKEHGGDITARNGKKGGAVIEVRLPLATDAKVPAEPVPAAAAKREGAIEGRVLLVEEEEAVLEFERDVLAGAGANVVTAKKSDDVKARLLSEPFDAIIMNGKLPGDWQAEEAYDWIKKNCAGMESHLLFTFSNGVEQGDTRPYLQENNIPHLVKPFEVADLIAQARKLLQKAKAAAAAAG
ncbi:MAG TPA: GAF domain-containing protein [Candidatus Sulfotelmatobacter sp.]|nr:GAF domain-containing protein [Candidatus Sulfotelmatobacter sp.]